MQRTLNHFALALCTFVLASGFKVAAQDTTATSTAPVETFSDSHIDNTYSKAQVFVGTQIPLQFTAGVGYRFRNRLSARAQAGFITKPYSGFIVDAMKAFGMDKQLARVIKKAFQRGTVIGIGPNYHFGKNYVGVFGQYMHLKGGGITPADALSVYFKKDFTQFDVLGLPTFEFSMQSDMVNAGALFGHEFRLRNPTFSINGEVGLSKIMTSKNSFTSNRPLVDQTFFAQNLYKEIDQEMQDAYWKYGFIPTLNLYFVYHL